MDPEREAFDPELPSSSIPDRNIFHRLPHPKNGPAGTSLVPKSNEIKVRTCLERQLSFVLHYAQASAE
jgi:hypothetical protein